MLYIDYLSWKQVKTAPDHDGPPRRSSLTAPCLPGRPHRDGPFQTIIIYTYLKNIQNYTFGKHLEVEITRKAPKIKETKLPQGNVPHTLSTKFYVHDNFSFQAVKCDCQNVVVVYLIKFSVYLVLVYRPPSAGFQENVKLVNFLTQNDL